MRLIPIYHACLLLLEEVNFFLVSCAGLEY